MKKHLLTIGAVALAIFATQQAAQATLTETSGSGNLVGPSSTVAVSYDVFFDTSDSLFTYVYQFTALGSTAPITQFTVNASYVDSVLSGSLAYYGLGSTTGTYFAAGSDSSSVEWLFGVSGQPTLETVAYTSLLGPTAGSGSLNDHNSGPWGDNPGTVGATPIPVPVPEASTVVAGALMLLPFGIGAIRSLRKERIV